MGSQMLGHDDDNVVEGDFEDVTSLQGDIDAQLDAIISEFAGEKDLSAKIKVYRVKPNSGKMAWAFDCLTEELPILERVRDEFGPGDYLSRLYIGGKLTKIFQFSIAAPSRSYAEANQKGSGSEIAALGEIMRQNFESMREMMQANNRQQGGMDAALDQLIKMKELFGADRGGSSIKELQEMVLLVDTLRGDGGDSEPKGVMDVLSGIVDKALPALSQAATAGQQQPQRRKNPAARPTQKQQPQQQQKPQSEDSGQMKMKLMYLCSMAEKNADPATYAGMIVDASTQQQLVELVELLKTDDWLEKFGEYHADVLNYRQWFGEVRQFIMDEVSPQLADDEQLGEVDSQGSGDDNQEKSATEKPGNVPETSENADNHHA
jgi:hypothetical protein